MLQDLCVVFSLTANFDAVGVESGLKYFLRFLKKKSLSLLKSLFSKLYLE